MAEKIDPAILKLIELGDRLTEDQLREIVMAEIERNEMDSVAQSYALQEADGDEKKARAYYTKHRVRRLKDMIAQESIRNEKEKADAEEKEKKEREHAKRRYFSQKEARAKRGKQLVTEIDPIGNIGKTITGLVIYAIGASVIVAVVSAIIEMSA